MISSAFKAAVQSEVSSQGKATSNMFQPAKEFAGAALSVFGMKNLVAAATIGEAATGSYTQEKMLSAVQSQEALDNAFLRSIEGAGQEDVAALTTVYEKLAGAKREQDAKRKLMEELKAGDEE